MTKYEILLKSKKKIFNVEDLIVLWKESNRRLALESVKGYVKRGKLFSVFKGVYSLDSNYNPFEVGQKLFTPSYITYYSALTYHGINFQVYSDVHLFALQSKKIKVQDTEFIYHKVREDILFNPVGIVEEGNFQIATKERAICDSLYLNKSVVFDNLGGLDQAKLIRISRIYNKRVYYDVKKLVVRDKNDARKK